MKSPGKIIKYVALSLVFVVACVLPIILNSSRSLKYQMLVLTLAMVWAIAALSLNLILGYTGQASLAHGAFMGIGAYMFAIFVERAGINFWLALPLACLFTAFLGLLIGLPSLRTRGPYFAIVTLCFNVIVFKVFENWLWLSGGYTGQRITLPSYLESRVTRYYVVLAFLILTILVIRQITKSLLGVSFFAIRSNENLAEAAGIHTFRTKLLSFTVSCFLVGISGAMLAMVRGQVDSTVTNYLYSFYILIYVLIGGVASLAGPVVGAVGLYYLLDRIKGTGEFRFVGFGLLLILVIIFLPRGIVGGVEQLWGWAKQKWWPAKTEEALE
jgi:branched-chain amino acid transport system permease protein